jgi:hypothetical protein
VIAKLIGGISAMANDSKSRSNDWMNEPLLGYREDQLGVLGLPLPKAPDHFATIMALLSAGPKFVPETMPEAEVAYGETASLRPQLIDPTRERRGSVQLAAGLGRPIGRGAR